VKTVIRLVAAVLFVVVFSGATCGHKGPTEVSPVQVMKLTDHVYYHNVSITYGNGHYYTINGGSDDWCRLNEYDNQGEFIRSYDVGVDGRTIFFRKADGELYVKPFDTDLLKVSLEDEDYDTEVSDAFGSEQSSVGFAPNGRRTYELSEGTVTVRDFETGEEVKSFAIDRYYNEFGFSSAIAASDKHLFVWGDEDEIVVYDLNGAYVTSFELPRKGFWASLSWCNGLLWIAKDADAKDEGGDGYWYGYRLSGLE